MDMKTAVIYRLEELIRQKDITEIEGHFTELQQQRQAEQEQGDTFPFIS